MGFIRKKTVKGNEYFYYCEKRRSRLKDGGNGKVITIEKILGKSIFYMPYLPYWLWDGLSVQDFIEAYAKFRLKEFDDDQLFKFDLEWKLKKGKPVKGKVTFRAIPGSGGDARESWPRYLRHSIQDVINQAIEYQNFKEDDIYRAAYLLARSEKAKEKMREYEDEYRLWKKDPDRRWDEDGIKYRYSDTYGDDCLELIEEWRNSASERLDTYLSLVENIVDTAPSSERKRFKAQVIQKSEKLAARSNYIDWFGSTRSD